MVYKLKTNEMTCDDVIKPNVKKGEMGKVN